MIPMNTIYNEMGIRETVLSFGKNIEKNDFINKVASLKFHEISYNERVTITPRNYPLIFRDTEDIENHYGIIGIAAGIDEYPLERN